MTAHIQSQAAVNCNHFNYLQYIFLRTQVVKDLKKGSTFLRFRGSIFQTVCYSCCMIWFQLLFPSLRVSYRDFSGWNEPRWPLWLLWLCRRGPRVENRPQYTWRSRFWLLSGLINFKNKYASSSGSGDRLGKGGSSVVLRVLPSLGWEVRVRAGSACLRPPRPGKQKSTCWTVWGSGLSERPGKAGKSRVCAAPSLLSPVLAPPVPPLDSEGWIGCPNGDEGDLGEALCHPSLGREWKGRLHQPSSNLTD